ncbi:MAG TPA: hypothetical protein VKS60_08335, partial [Stellaceae bacterium]|nr:hypothetical protein [Stellaceae bacterium]
SRLPWNEPFLERLRSERAHGRRIFLASASTRTQVEAVAQHLGLFDGVYASDDTVNLKSGAKAAALVQDFGEGGFDYAGNSSADLAVWQRAGGVVAVNAGAALLRRVVRQWPRAVVVPAVPPAVPDRLSIAGAGLWPAALLAGLPLVVVGPADLGGVLRAAAAALMLASSMAGASILAELVALGRDRRDPVRRSRPLAAGRIPPPRAILPMLGAFVLAFLPAPWLGLSFLGVVLAEAGLTVAAKRTNGPTTGWVLRALWLAGPILGGCLAIGFVPAPPWLGVALALCITLAVRAGPGQAGAISRRRDSV